MPVRRVIRGLLAFILVICVATFCYTVAGNSLLDSFYMVIVTVFGVGYHEVVPTTSAGMRFVTIGVIVAGTTAAVYTVSAVLQFMTQGEIERLLGERKRMRTMRALSGHTIICGFGRMGQILARDLVSRGHEIAIIEADPDRVGEAQALDYLVLQGNATNEDLLIEAGLRNAANIACVLPDDSNNVFISLSARNINPDVTIVARGEIPTTEPKLLQAGANHVVLPPAIGGSRMAEIILGSSVSRLNGMGKEQNLLGQAGLGLCAVTIAEGGDTLGSRLKPLDGESSVPHVAIGIRSAAHTVTIAPDPSYVTQAGDELLLVCAVSDMPVLQKRLGASSR